MPKAERSSALARRELWLGALHHLALADGDFSEAEGLRLTEQLRPDLPEASWEQLPLPGLEALVHRFGIATPIAEEFLRSAVLVALADGHLSREELVLLRQWSTALKVGQDWLASLPDACSDSPESGSVLDPIKDWLDRWHPSDPAVARFLARLIPAQCPFERDLKLFGYKLVHIPPMCKINPFYEQLVALRLRCLDTLANPQPPREETLPTPSVP